MTRVSSRPFLFATNALDSPVTMRTLGSTLLVLAALPFSGCSWGTVDAVVSARLSSRNYEYYEDLLYPAAERDVMDELFGARLPACEEEGEDCEEADKDSAGSFEMRLPYDTDEVRGLFTQKGDLQLTAHLQVGDGMAALAEEDWEPWSRLFDEAKSWGVAGDGCGEGADLRSGAGRCWADAVRAAPEGYQEIKRDLRLVILVNLPGADDTRDPDCAEIDADFSVGDWEYPRMMRINQDVGVQSYQVDGNDDLIQDDGEDWRSFYDPAVVPPLAQCDLEAFALLQLGPEQFSADWFGETEYEERRKDIPSPSPDDLQDWEFGLDATNPEEEALLGTVEIQSISLPGSDDPRAKGRFHLRFESQRFPNRDGLIDVEGDFDVEVRADAEAVTDPERQLDIGPQAEGE